jgi:hypothetical protein
VKSNRQKYFVTKQLRLSVSVMVLWSFLAVGVLNYLTIEISKRMTPFYTNQVHNLLLIALIFLAYASFLFLFVMRFSRIFIGPFERLKREIIFFLAGKYHQRLLVREQDDIYIRSFVDAVNNVLNGYERTCMSREKIIKLMDEEIIKMLSVIDRENVSKEQLRKTLLVFCEKVKDAAWQVPGKG